MITQASEKNFSGVGTSIGPRGATAVPHLRRCVRRHLPRTVLRYPAGWACLSLCGNSGTALRQTGPASRETCCCTGCIRDESRAAARRVSAPREDAHVVRRSCEDFITMRKRLSGKIVAGRVPQQIPLASNAQARVASRTRGLASSCSARVSEVGYAAVESKRPARVGPGASDKMKGLLARRIPEFFRGESE